MVKFVAALATFLATAQVSSAIPVSLVKTARDATVANPSLRTKEANRRQLFQQKVLSMSKPTRSLQNNGNYNYNGQQQNYNGQQQNYNGQQQNNNGQQQQQGQQDQQQGNYYQQQQQWNNANAYEQAEADWNNWESDWYWNQQMAEENFGFQISNFAIKFTQCATVESYSDDLADDEYTDTVLAAQRFAIFRLCPAGTCSANNNEGCSNNYGEYMVSMDQYLAALMEEEEQRVIQYCQYCQNCATLQSAKTFWAEVDYHRQMALTQAEESYQEWYQTSLAEYQQNQNGGQNGQYANANYNQAQQGNYGNQYQNVQDMDDVDLQQAYYNYIRDKSNYANDYYENNYGGNNNGYNQNDNSQTYQWTDEQYWNFQQVTKTYESNQANWANLGGGTYATFYNKAVLNGYYDQNGDFVQAYGFFGGENGEYVFLENEEMEWDATIWGEMPEEWDGIDKDTESCSSEYAGSCYDQYDACMAILQDYDYWAYRAFQGGQNVNYEGGNDDDQVTLTLKEVMTCTEFEMVQEGNDYANQQYYQKKYQEKQEWLQNEYNCYDGDDQCQTARQYALQKYEYELQKELERRYFVGPHCGSNGKDISIAVFKDEFCSVLDENTAVEDLLGFDPAGHLNLVPDECINCGVNEEMMAQAMWYEDEDMENYIIEPMCSMLYQLAGKCNRNLNMNVNNVAYQYSADWNQVFQSQQQQANEDAVCSFLDSLKSNTYDENGQVVLTSENAWKNPAQWNKEFQVESNALSAGMKAAVSLMAIAVGVMAVWACFLHGTLARKNIPWRPRRKLGEDPTDIARQNSGIVMGRSRSGPGQAPLI